MTATDFLKYLEKEIHTAVAATVDENGLPVTCAVDIMDSDASNLYFLTAKGKGLYKRLKNRGYMALTGIKGESTMSCVAVSVQGKVKELGSALLQQLFEKNPYMQEIYPTKESQKALTVFALYQGSGEWFDLSKKPIERFSFAFGQAKKKKRATSSQAPVTVAGFVKGYARKTALILRQYRLLSGRKTACVAATV